MAKRRGAGEGSIYQAKDGRWRAEVSLGYKPDGKPLRKIVYARTRGEVSATLKKLLAAQQRGINVKPQRQTVESFLRSWLSDIVAPKNRAQTLRSYTWLVDSHIAPALGKLTLERLTPQRIQEFIAERHASGLSPATVKHVRATLRAALSHAERWGFVHQNAAKLVTVPAAERYQPTVLTPDQAQLFLRFTEAHVYGPLLAVAITLGLRRGELLALRWRDVDLDAASLHVRHSLERTKGVGATLSQPKSEKARRTLTLPAITVKALLEQRGRQELAKTWAGSGWVERDFIFSTPGGNSLPPEYVSSELKSVLKAAGLPLIRFHDLRHSCATLLLAMGCHPKMVQETLGHSTFALTMDTYSHAIPALRNDVAAKMDAVFSPTPTKAPTKAAAERVH